MKFDGIILKKVPAVVMQYQGMIEGDVVPRCIEGSTGKTYWGREVVVFNHLPGLFGTRLDGRVRRRALTICNGIINQCSLDNPPTPYWAVLDAMSELKVGFTRKLVIDRAVKTVGEVGRRACELAWDVLRNHHRHARKCDAGLAYMLDAEGGLLSIRARCEDETVQYFASQSERKRLAPLHEMLSEVK